MRRWFRRKGKEEEGREEEAAAFLPEETEPGSGAAGDLPPAGANESSEPEAAPPEAALPEPGPEAPDPALPEVLTDAGPARRGFLRRWRREPQPADAAPITSEAGAAEAVDAAPAPQPEPPPPEEPEPAPDLAAASEPESAAPLPEAGTEAAAPVLPEAEDLEETGEVPEAAARQGMFRRLRERLTRTREALGGGLDRLFRGRKVVDAELLEDLEELLITADLGVETSLFLIQALQDKLRRRELADVEKLKAALQAEMIALLAGPAQEDRNARPWVVLVVGINGVGKTTTIAKLAHRDRHQGLTPLLVAGDTFRAAAVEQLEIWGERIGAPVVKQKTGADPAAVVFDGLAAAVARGVDSVYVDTAGRLHTKVNLMEELKKINRTAAKKIPGAPHEVLLILDATTGQNALSQARLFHEAVGVTGLILTKMDGSAKGGVALAVVHETGIPLKYIGVGEAMEDLRPFDPEAFVEAILG
jgi:fused signal recognition particle receptor